MIFFDKSQKIVIESKMGVEYLFELINDFSKDQKAKLEEYIEKVREEEKGEIGNSFCYGIYDDGCFQSGDEWLNWHEYEEHMTRLSRNFPKILFILKVEYELKMDRFGDVKKFYFQNGKSTSIKGMKTIIWLKPFQPEKLKDKKLKKKEYDMSKVVFLGY